MPRKCKGSIQAFFEHCAKDIAFMLEEIGYITSHVILTYQLIQEFRNRLESLKKEANHIETGIQVTKNTAGGDAQANHSSLY